MWPNSLLTRANKQSKIDAILDKKKYLIIRLSLYHFDYLFYSEKSYLTKYFTIICKMSLSLDKKFASTRADGIIYLCTAIYS